MTTGQIDLFSQPKTRARDRATSKDAATVAAKGSAVLEQAIVEAVGWSGQYTDEEIVEFIRQEHGDRWKGSTIVSARARCVDAGRLRDTGETRRNRRGRSMTVWRQR
jgi:hypothetical protein